MNRVQYNYVAYKTVIWYKFIPNCILLRVNTELKKKKKQKQNIVDAVILFNFELKEKTTSKNIHNPLPMMTKCKFRFLIFFFYLKFFICLANQSNDDHIFFFNLRNYMTKEKNG